MSESRRNPTTMFRNVLIVLALQYSSCGAGLNEDTAQNWKLVENWPRYENFGQISAVSIDNAGNVYVFHRGQRVWDEHSFDLNNVFRQKESPPIPEETIVVLNQSNGNAIKKVGGKRFYMPHGLTVDYMNNIWITDVALHQVFKFPPLNMSANSGLAEAEIVLGTQFQPGNDNEHFCKPTDVAVDKYTGDFFVTDGYCNARVIKYDKNCNKLLEWGRASPGTLDVYTLLVPHALAIAADVKTLFVADRENSRTVEYNITKGTFVKSFDNHNKIYSVAYSSVGGKHLFTLSNSSETSPGVVTVYNAETKSVLKVFSPPNHFTNPHDLAVSSDGRHCYVVELSPHKVWKFELASPDKRKLVSETTEDSIAPHTEKTDFPAGTLLAIVIVSFVIMITFLIFVFHVYRKKEGYSQYEMRKLILEDEE